MPMMAGSFATSNNMRASALQNPYMRSILKSVLSTYVDPQTMKQQQQQQQQTNAFKSRSKRSFLPPKTPMKMATINQMRQSQLKDTVVISECSDNLPAMMRQKTSNRQMQNSRLFQMDKKQYSVLKQSVTRPNMRDSIITDRTGHTYKVV